MKNSDQQAFPDPMRGAEQSIDNQNPYERDSGLTKREYFAAMAMQGILSNPTLCSSFKELATTLDSNIDVEIARNSIEIADELLSQLENK